MNPAELSKLVAEIEEATGEKRTELRLSLRKAIAAVVRKITVHIHRRGMVALAFAHVQLEGKRERIFAVRMERGVKPISFSDARLYREQRGIITDEAINRLAAKTMEARDTVGMTLAWVDILRRRRLAGLCRVGGFAGLDGLPPMEIGVEPILDVIEVLFVGGPLCRDSENVSPSVKTPQRPQVLAQAGINNE